MGFLELRHQCGVSHEVRRGAQRASRVVLGTSPPTSGRGSSICLGGWADTCSLSSEGPQAPFICGPVSPGWASCAGTSWLVGRHLYPTDASSTPSCRMSSDLASGPAYSVLRGQRL